MKLAKIKYWKNGEDDTYFNEYSSLYIDYFTGVISGPEPDFKHEAEINTCLVSEVKELSYCYTDYYAEPKIVKATERKFFWLIKREVENHVYPIKDMTLYKITMLNGNWYLVESTEGLK